MVGSSHQTLSEAVSLDGLVATLAVDLLETVEVIQAVRTVVEDQVVEGPALCKAAFLRQVDGPLAQTVVEDLENEVAFALNLADQKAD